MPENRQTLHQTASARSSLPHKDCPLASAVASDTPTVTYWTGDQEATTFGSEQLHHWVTLQIDADDRVLNPCAGPTELRTAAPVDRIDVKDLPSIDYQGDFREIVPTLPADTYDVIVYDPPYTPHQARQKYDLDLTDAEFDYFDRHIYDEFARVLTSGGRLIQFGYEPHTAGHPNYTPTDVAVFNKLGAQNDYLGVTATYDAPTDTATRRRLSGSCEPNPFAPPSTGGSPSVGGNNGTAIDITYQLLADEGGQKWNHAVTQLVNDHLTSQATETTNAAALVTLDGFEHVRPAALSADMFEIDVRLSQDAPVSTNSPPDTVATVNAEDYAAVQIQPTDGVAARVTLPVWRLSDYLGDSVFDQAILDLPASAHQRTVPVDSPTDSTKTHVHALIKDHIADSIRPGGRVTEISQTATVMNSHRYPYVRQQVSLLAAPDRQAQFITSDKTNHRGISTAGYNLGPTAPGLASRPIHTHSREQAGSQSFHTGWRCPRCGVGVPVHPALSAPCSTCGAAHDTRCSGFTTPARVHTSRLVDGISYHLRGACLSDHS
ncbi:hypothetical protein RYH80_18140 [Halobaculum sp. MBLA0147]|uniref:hypothetical protein n=1 Tax=Halobaculum sp. MBLA0147 TaxID=3079934 RepID=UPI003525E916